MAAYASLYARLIANITPPENDQACWTWKGSRDRWGYGRFAVRTPAGPRNRMAHIEMFKHFADIPDGHQLDHLCRNPSCINPDHLDPVAPKVNAQRRSAARGFPYEVRV